MLKVQLWSAALSEPLSLVLYILIIVNDDSLKYELLKNNERKNNHQIN